VWVAGQKSNWYEFDCDETWSRWRFTSRRFSKKKNFS